jgi:hypothetical protein
MSRLRHLNPGSLWLHYIQLLGGDFSKFALEPNPNSNGQSGSSCSYPSLIVVGPDVLTPSYRLLCRNQESWHSHWSDLAPSPYKRPPKEGVNKHRTSETTQASKLCTRKFCSSCSIAIPSRSPSATSLGQSILPLEIMSGSLFNAGPDCPTRVPALPKLEAKVLV